LKTDFEFYLPFEETIFVPCTTLTWNW